MRAKLEAAEAATATDDRFAVNVSALREVIPEPIGIDQIEARLGSVWISPEIHEQFLRELLKDRTVRVENPMPGAWEVRGYRAGIEATNEWGTLRRPATDIAQAVMEQRRVEVHDEVEDSEGRTRRVLNPVETTAAQRRPMRCRPASPSGSGRTRPVLSSWGRSITVASTRSACATIQRLAII